MRRSLALALLLLGPGCSRETETPARAAGPAPAPAPAPAPEPEAMPAPRPKSKGEEPIVVTDAQQVPSLVGKLVTLIGTQTRTKQPTVLGVDVDDDPTLADRTVQVTGILHRHVVERDPNEGVPPGEHIATRGPGTYYSIVDPTTQRLAKPVRR